MEIPKSQPRSSWPVDADMLTERDERIQLGKPDRRRQICLLYSPSKGCTHKSPHSSSSDRSAVGWGHPVLAGPCATGSQQQPQALAQPWQGHFHRGSTRLWQTIPAQGMSPSCSAPALALPSSAALWHQCCLGMAFTGRQEASQERAQGYNWDSDLFPKGTASKQPQPQPCSTCSQSPW